MTMGNMKPILLTKSELDNVLENVTAPKARIILDHVYRRLTTHNEALARLVGADHYSSIIHNCINTRIKDLGLRLIPEGKYYSFVRFGILRTNVYWPVCNTPRANINQRWIIR